MINNRGSKVCLCVGGGGSKSHELVTGIVVACVVEYTLTSLRAYNSKFFYLVYTH